MLACPAMGGQCCGDADILPASASATSSCGDCCSHNEANHTGNDAPVSPSCPNDCHDCFCAGALPPAFETSVPELDFDAFIGFVVVSIDSPLSASNRAFSYRSDPGGFSPPSGRALLTSYCTLLL